ncbi:MAG: DUF3179 domain-containing protein [Gemmatimonadota bacterium]
MMSRPPLLDRRTFLRSTTGLLVGGSAWLVQAGCDSGLPTASDPAGDGGSGPDAPSSDSFCTIDEGLVFRAAPRDGIPSLTDPPTTSPDGSGLGYLRPNDRVIGVVVNNDALAVPLNILWWHEIVHAVVGGRRVAITHCPLTGSSLMFDREPLDGVEFGVSGLLYLNNLMMYDRTDDASMWPQMERAARCGSRSGAELTMLPVLETTWSGWKALWPHTRVLTSDTGWERSYHRYPYGPYDEPHSRELLFPLEGDIDVRRPPKERVLGIVDDRGAAAYPFGRLDEVGPAAAVPDGPHVIFWNRDARAAMAYFRTLDDRALSFEISNGDIVDADTGSRWRIDGLAVSGPLEGRRLDPVPEAYVAYWFAWAAFHSDTFLWRSE